MKSLHDQSFNSTREYFIAKKYAQGQGLISDSQKTASTLLWFKICRIKAVEANGKEYMSVCQISQKMNTIMVSSCEWWHCTTCKNMRIWNVLRMTVYGRGGFDVNWILTEIKAHANLKPQKIVVIAKYVRNFLTYFYSLTVVGTNYTSQGNEGNNENPRVDTAMLREYSFWPRLIFRQFFWIFTWLETGMTSVGRSYLTL